MTKSLPATESNSTEAAIQALPRTAPGALKSLLLPLLAWLGAGVLPLTAEMPPVEPKRVSTTADFRQWLLSNKWSWRNVSAGVPDRECVFMPDGTFRHPHFTARFTIKDIKTVELNRKGGERAVMTFQPDYLGFEALDFDKARRITGQRLPK